MRGVGRIAPALAVLVAVGTAAAMVVITEGSGAAAPRHASMSGAAPASTVSESGQAPPPIIKRVDNPDMQIAITFDACATNSYGYGFDRPVFEVLQREQTPATIFVSGLWVESHPEAMKELAAEPMIEFANHSYDHPHMGRMSVPEIEDELDRTEAALRRYGVRSVAFRPPFGEFSDRLLEVARDRQLPAVLWDVVSGDPTVGTTTEAILRTVVKKTRSGSIVIFHINGRETKTALALPPILRQLRARGFQFVQLSTLLAWRSVSDPPPPPDDDATLPLGPPVVKVREPVRDIVREIDRMLAPPVDPPGGMPLGDVVARPPPGCAGRVRASCR